MRGRERRPDRRQRCYGGWRTREARVIREERRGEEGVRRDGKRSMYMPRLV